MRVGEAELINASYKQTCNEWKLVKFENVTLEEDISTDYLILTNLNFDC